jgi:hypothetical protein
MYQCTKKTSTAMVAVGNAYRRGLGRAIDAIRCDALTCDQRGGAADGESEVKAEQEENKSDDSSYDGHRYTLEERRCT